MVLFIIYFANLTHLPPALLTGVSKPFTPALWYILLSKFLYCECFKKKKVTTDVSPQWKNKRGSAAVIRSTRGSLGEPQLSITALNGASPPPPFFPPFLPELGRTSYLHLCFP